MLIHQDRMLRLAQTALADGAERPSLTRIVWKSLAGNCSNAQTVELRSRPPERRDLLVMNKGAWGPSQRGSEKFVGIGPDTMIPLTVELEVPCRQCANCLARRRASWSYRAKAELARSTRTWFCTFTLRPEEQYKALVTASLEMKARCVHFEALSPREQFIARHNIISREITRYLKRVRKQSGAKLRYLFVAEAHASGDPHYHALIHEFGHSVRKRLLQAQWKLGFSSARLVTDTREATYLCKYLSKDAAARVRASQNYGKDTSSDIAQSRIGRLAPRALDPRPHATVLPLRSWGNAEDGPD